MTVALAGRAPSTFEIKSANLPLVSLLLKSADLATLAEELNGRFGDIPDFFDNDPLVLDLTALSGAGEIDFGELLHLLRGYKVVPVAVRGGSAVQVQAAVLKGLAVANDLQASRQASPEREAAPLQSQPAANEEAPSRAKDPPARREKAAATAAPASAPSSAPVRADAADGPVTALIIDKPLRSGQQVYARGRDLIVMSMVNPGAEVIADGNIHVYAPLRGKAIAGARGNTEARIVSLCLEAELISIAGVYRTSEVPLPAELLGKPAQVRLVGGPEGKLAMEPLHGGR
jgi:septum site-determining protein MinC